MRWAQPAENRDQLVLFSTQLADVIEIDHTVRIIDSLLDRLDWGPRILFGARQFLTRGLTSVRQEWRWLSSAFNLNQLVGNIRRGAQPP